LYCIIYYADLHFIEKEVSMEETLGALIGKRVQELRKHRGLTQAELAEKSGVPQGNISRLERGILEHIEVVTLVDLAAGLRVKPATLLPERAPAPDKRPRRKRQPPAADAKEEAA
jgi:transcriptional regulator with XRE-family HTH domain